MSLWLLYLAFVDLFDAEWLSKIYYQMMSLFLLEKVGQFLVMWFKLPTGFADHHLVTEKQRATCNSLTRLVTWNWHIHPCPILFQVLVNTSIVLEVIQNHVLYFFWLHSLFQLSKYFHKYFSFDPCNSVRLNIFILILYVRKPKLKNVVTYLM